MKKEANKHIDIQCTELIASFIHDFYDLTSLFSVAGCAVSHLSHFTASYLERTAAAASGPFTDDGESDLMFAATQLKRQ